MSNLIKNNYKLIFKVLIFIITLPLIPITLEIIFKFGLIIGNYIRVFECI